LNTLQLYFILGCLCLDVLYALIYQKSMNSV